MEHGQWFAERWKQLDSKSMQTNYLDGAEENPTTNTMACSVSDSTGTLTVDGYDKVHSGIKYSWWVWNKKKGDYSKQNLISNVKYGKGSVKF